MQRNAIARLGVKHRQDTDAAFYHLIDGLSTAVRDALINAEASQTAQDAVLDVFRAVKGHDPLTRGRTIRGRTNYKVVNHDEGDESP